MQLAKSSRKTIEDFFRFYLGDEYFSLPKMNFYAGKFSKFLTSSLRIHGITIGRKIYITPELLFVNSDENNALPDDLIVHEIAHVLQYRKEGFWMFLYKYLLEYKTNLKKLKKYDAAARSRAYWEISYEREAREIAASFSRWKDKKT